MGNQIHGGYHIPPKKFLEEYRKSMLINEKRRDKTLSMSSVIQENAITEITAENFLVRNPLFLDDFVNNNISIYRLDEWIKSNDLYAPDVCVLVPRDNEMETTKLQRLRYYHYTRALTYPKYPSVLAKDQLMAKNEFNEANPPVDIESHLFSNIDVDPHKICLIFMYMTEKLLGRNAFPQKSLARFLARVQVNYYKVPYHNIYHSLGHAQSMYWILRNNPGIFTEIEMKILMIASFVHDVGHPGFDEEMCFYLNNNQIYNVPYLEKCHTQTLFCILLNDTSDIFSTLSNCDFISTIDLLKECIISTYFKYYGKQIEMLKEINEQHHNIHKSKYKKDIMAILMMVCDLSAGWKRWNSHVSSTWAVYAEFFSQGDIMNKMGFNVPCHMDKKNMRNVPSYQINFLDFVILPLLRETSKIFPCIEDALIQSERNRTLWFKEIHYELWKQKLT